MSAKNRRVIEYDKKESQREIVDTVKELENLDKEQSSMPALFDSYPNVHYEITQGKLNFSCCDEYTGTKKIDLTLDLIGDLFEKFDIHMYDEYFYDEDITENNWIDHWNGNSYLGKQALIEWSIGAMLDTITRTKDNGDRVFVHAGGCIEDLVVYFYGRDICSKDEEFIFLKRKPNVDAKEEIAYAQFYIAREVARGRIGEEYIGEASKWYKKSAANGYKPAIDILEGGDLLQKYQLAFRYLTEGDNEKKETAIRMFEELADANDANGLTTLGEIYLLGGYCEKNIEKGKEYIWRAAELGSPGALARIGLMYFYAEEMEEDKEKGLNYLKKASDLGRLDAMVKYAFALIDYAKDLEGEKSVKYVEDAIQQLSLSAMLGNNEASVILEKIMGCTSKYTS